MTEFSVEQVSEGRFRVAGRLSPAVGASDEQRARLRQALPAETVDAIVAARSRVEGKGLGAIRIDDVITLEDLKLDWLRDPVVRLVRAIGLLSQTGLDGKAFGKLPGRFRRVADAAAEVAELDDFLSNFEGEILQEIWLPILDAAVIAAAELTVALTAEDGNEAREARDRYEEHRDDFETTHYPLLHVARFTRAEDLGLSLPSGGAYSKKLFGVNLMSRRLRRGYSEWSARLEKAGYDARALADQQLAYLGPLAVPDESLANYVNFAIRIGSTAFPLLGHRATYLTNQLVRDASARSPKVVHDFVAAFFRDESSWIMAAGPKYEEALAAYLNHDDPPAIVEALRILSEGVFRPYASLLCSLAEAVEGRAKTSFSVEPTLGALEQRMAPLSHPALRLLGSFTPRELRNADAHERATIGASGDLIIRKEDGTTETIVANHVFGHTTSLRSALDGVDVAINLFFATDLMNTATFRYTPTALSREALTYLARGAAHRRTSGAVQRVEPANGRLTVVYRGWPWKKEVFNMLFLLGHMTFGHFDQLVAVGKRGRTLGRVIRLDFTDDKTGSFAFTYTREK